MKKFLTRIDAEDTFLGIGSSLLVAGVTVIYKPAGTILAGLLFIVLAALMSRRSR